MHVFTFHDLLMKNLGERGNHPMLVERNRQATYREVARQVEATARWLIDAGVGRGDRVAVQLHKSIEEVVAMFAAARIGAAFVNVNYQWTDEQLDYVLRDCEVSALITDRRHARSLASIELPDTLHHVLVKGACPEHARMTAWENIPTDLPPPDPVGIDTDLAAILYTSGSSGKPKGVMLSNLNCVQGTRSVVRYLHNVPEDRLLSLLPFSFDYGINQLRTMCMVGGTVVLEPVMMPAEIVKTLVEQRVTGLAAVPPAWIPIVRYLDEQPTELPDLRYVTNSGGKIPEPILELMPRVFPNTKIYLMYGLTEAFRSTYLRPELFEEKMGSMGKAIPNVETFVIDPEIGICGPGQRGELVHRGSLVSMGYWGKEEATEERIKPCPQLEDLIGDEKVVYSGDIVEIDDDGFYWFVGRRDAMIKSRGFRISPTEVEEIVHGSGLVASVVAIAAPDEVDGQAVEIAVTAPDDEPVDTAAVRQYCRRKMPTYMVPRRVHHWRGEFPRTASGKIDRRRVARRCIDDEST